MNSENKEEIKDIISIVDYDETNPTYQKIKDQFTNKLKEKYNCQDYNMVTDCIFEYVFKKKIEKSKCIETFNSTFNNKASEIIDYLWTITREAEKEQESRNNQEEKNNYNNFKKGGKNFDEKYKNKGKKAFDNRQRYFKGKNKDRSRERSRDNSKESNDNKDDDNYEDYPVKQKGFYPSKGGFGMPMMPIGGGYPPYYPPQMIPPYMR
jgi:hypothetical protein